MSFCLTFTVYNAVWLKRIDLLLLFFHCNSLYSCKCLGHKDTKSIQVFYSVTLCPLTLFSSAISHRGNQSMSTEDYCSFSLTIKTKLHFNLELDGQQVHMDCQTPQPTPAVFLSFLHNLLYELTTNKI